VEGLHQAVEGVDTVGKTEDAGGTTDKEAARGVGGAIAGMNENAGTTGDALQTRQACAPHFRPLTGRTQKAGRGNIETEIVPFMIDSERDKVETAAAAVSGGVWSMEHGVAYCSNYGELQDELQQIKEEKKVTQPTTQTQE